MHARPQTLPPEWLDSLPQHAPEAIASRDDLRVFNRLLGTERWLREVVGKELHAGERVLEIGAGDGDIASRMLKQSYPWDPLDLAAMPEWWPRAARWYQADALTFNYSPSHAVIVANLVLHHFDDQQLAALGGRLAATARVIVVNDLTRSAWRAWLFPVLCRLIHAHRVTRHDGVLSIRAGFRDEELPRALKLDPARWRWTTIQTIPGAYRLVAIKHS
jgi:Methylase involved in ubiquinone/menaquinone biosynthesis